MGRKAREGLYVFLRFLHALMHLLAHHYVAEVVGGLHQVCDWNDDRQTCGCIAGPWQ